MRFAVLAFLLAGCGEVHFVDPNPPQLFRNSISYTSAAVDEPIVWIAILNLFFEDASGCEWARGVTLSALQQGLAAAGGRQLALSAQDLSPECRQRGQRPLDVTAVRAQFDSAQAAFPGAHVRPVIVYVDNVDLPLSGETFIALRTVRTRPDDAALVWAISHPTVSSQIGADRAIAWTYAGDPGLADRLGATAKAELPLQTTAALSSGPIPLLAPPQLATTREFKLCSISDENADHPELGAAHTIDSARPPTVTFALPQRVATPKSAFQTSSFSAVVEGCTANCDRYYIGEAGADPVQWDETSRCLLRKG